MTMSSLNKDTLNTFLAKIPVLFLTFVETVILIRLLGKEGNGVYTYIIANAELANLMLDFNMRGCLTYFLAKGKIITEKLLGLMLIIIFVGYVLFGILTVTLFSSESSLIRVLLPHDYIDVFFLFFLLINFALIFLRTFFESILRGNLLFQTLNIFEILHRAILAVGYIAVWFLTAHKGYELKPLFIIIVVMQMTGILLMGLMTMRKTKLKANFDISFHNEIRPYFQYALKGYFSALANFANKKLDIWLVQLFVGVSALGVYSLASRYCNFILMFTFPLNQVIMPYLTKMERKQGDAVLLLFSRITTTLIFGLAVLFFVATTFLIPLLFGQEFIEAVVPAQILLFGIVFLAIRNIFGMYMYAYDMLKFHMFANLFGLLITLVLDLILIPRYGILGASIASVASYGGSCIIVMFYALRSIKQSPLKAFFLRPNDIRMIFLKRQNRPNLK